jgi:imidazoleglycerol-phosphate dehydratase/histidinol-phosphatase
METSNIPAARQGYRRRCLSDIWLEVAVDFDRLAPVDVVTDLDAFSDALGLLARGGGFALRLHCEGGPCADTRLLVEDCALELGAALRDAIGSATNAAAASRTQRVEVPGAAVSVDFSGRPGATCPGLLATEQAAGLPAGIFTAFFDSLARALGARIEIEVRSGVPKEAIDASFAGVGRALRAASDAGQPRPRRAVSRQ